MSDKTDKEKLEARLDAYTKRYRELDAKLNELRIKINQIHVKLDSYGRREQKSTG